MCRMHIDENDAAISAHVSNGVSHFTAPFCLHLRAAGPLHPYYCGPTFLCTNFMADSYGMIEVATQPIGKEKQYV
jgi:hypothetical protein